MDRMQKLASRVGRLEEKQSTDKWSNTNKNDKPKLAGAIVFASFMALFILGFIYQWQWGWLVAIGVMGVIMPVGISEG